MNNILKYRLCAMVVFAAALFLPHFLWEATVAEDSVATIFGSTALAGFWEWVQTWTTQACYHLLHLFSDNINLPNAYTLRWRTGNYILVVLSCTAIKQYWLQLLIILCTALYTYFAVPNMLKRNRFPLRKYILQTTVYIILCLLILVIFNIIRICIATLAIGHSYELYQFLHGQVLRYGFYGIMFLSWVFWVEHILKYTTPN